MPWWVWVIGGIGAGYCLAILVLMANAGWGR